MGAFTLGAIIVILVLVICCFLTRCRCPQPTPRSRPRPDFNDNLSHERGKYEVSKTASLLVISILQSSSIRIIRMILFELYARILTYGILSYVHIFWSKNFVT